VRSVPMQQVMTAICSNEKVATIELQLRELPKATGIAIAVGVTECLKQRLPRTGLRYPNLMN
jgi:hypothetical protein